MIRYISLYISKDVSLNSSDSPTINLNVTIINGSIRSTDQPPCRRI